MSGPSVAEVHDRILISLIQAVGIYAVLKIIRRGSRMPEGDEFFPEAVFFRKKLVKNMICIVDDKRRRPCKIGMSPCVRKDVHGYADRLQRSPLCKLHCLNGKVSVGTADKTVLVEIQSGTVRL